MIETTIKRAEIEHEERWDVFQDAMEFIELKEGWKFRVTPPFAGAVLRFKLLAPSGREYSVYFDAFNRLGIFGKPYFEIYEIDSDVFRSTDINEIIEVMYAEEAQNG